MVSDTYPLHDENPPVRIWWKFNRVAFCKSFWGSPPETFWKRAANRRKEIHSEGLSSVFCRSPQPGESLRVNEDERWDPLRSKCENPGRHDLWRMVFRYMKIHPTERCYENSSTCVFLRTLIFVGGSAQKPMCVYSWLEGPKTHPNIFPEI